MSEITNAEQARASLERAREDYRDLVLGLSSEGWNRQSDSPGWKNKHICWHIAWAAEAGEGFILRLRERKGIPSSQLFMAIFDVLQLWMVRVRARSATPESVLAQFERGYGRMFVLADNVGDDEWDNGAMVQGEYMTVGGGFGRVQTHIDEHAPDVRRD